MAGRGWGSATAARAGIEEPPSEAVGGRSQPGQRSVESDRTKKRLELAGLRADAAFAMEQFAMSERQACRLVELDRSSYRPNPLDVNRHPFHRRTNASPLRFRLA